MIMDLSLITSQLNESIWMMIIRSRSHNNIQVPKPFCVSFGWFGCIFVMVKKKFQPSLWRWYWSRFLSTCSTLIPHRFVVFNVICFLGCFAVKGGCFAVKIPVFEMGIQGIRCWHVSPHVQTPVVRGV